MADLLLWVSKLHRRRIRGSHDGGEILLRQLLQSLVIDAFQARVLGEDRRKARNRHLADEGGVCGADNLCDKVAYATTLLVLGEQDLQERSTHAQELR